jgi:hypothetical protein
MKKKRRKRKVYEIPATKISGFYKKLRRMAGDVVNEVLECSIPVRDLKHYCNLPMVDQIADYCCNGYVPGTDNDGEEEGYMLMDQDSMEVTVEIIAEDIYQSLLSKMAADDKIQVVFDDEYNVFKCYRVREDAWREIPLSLMDNLT